MNPRPDRSAIRLALAVAFFGACGGDDAPAKSTTFAITSVSPNEASARGGATVSLEGSGLASVIEVRFGDLLGEVVSASDGQVDVRVPAAFAGAVDVVAKGDSGSVTLEEGFTFTAIPLHFVNAAPVRLPPSALSGRAVAIGDLDGDGAVDLVAAGGFEGVWVFYGDGAGAFGEPSAIPLGDAIAEDTSVLSLADFDGDGSLDLFVAASDQPSAHLFVKGKTGALAVAPASSLPALAGPLRSALQGDFDGDGDIDLVLVVTPSDPALSAAALFWNDGEGQFDDVTEERLAGSLFTPTGAAAGDVDGDGDTDLFFASASDPPRLYLNDGQGTFGLAPPDAFAFDPALGAGVPAMGDLDGDGSLDVYLPVAGQDRVYWNDGKGHFFDRTVVSLGPETAAGQSATVIDLDRDGFADVVVQNSDGPVTLLHNDGAGRLFDYTLQVQGNDKGLSCGGAAVGDVDGDGDLDLFVSRRDLAPPALFLSWDPDPMDDADGDGVIDAVDNCKLVKNPDQANRDSAHFGCVTGADCLAATGCALAARGDSAQLFCSATPLTFDEAVVFCEALGGALGVVDDEEENAYLAAAGAGSLWVSATDALTEGTFLTAAGGPLPFSAWAMDEPNDSGGAEDCAILATDGLWNDVDCAAKHAYFCEDVRARPADPGDACDDCPDKNRPGAAPNDGEGGATCGGEGGAGGSGGGSGGMGGGG